MPTNYQVDVLVIGGGNAALCAAFAAREQGASVLIVEKSVAELRGGNSRHTRNLRCAHDAPNGTLVDSYTAQTYWQDLLRVTGCATNASLAQLLIDESSDIRDWMGQRGAQFQPALAGTLSLAHSNAFFLGGGRALLNRYYQHAQQLGIEVWYQAQVTELDIRSAEFHSAGVVISGQSTPEQVCNVQAQQLIVASGGLQSNKAWLREVWGPAADNLLIRGTQQNTGEVFAALDAAGAVTVGDPKACHAVAIDARAPKFDGGIVTRLDCIPFGIVVNTRGERFYDEGEDLWPKRYAIWGGLVAEQPNQLAYVVFDAAAAQDFMPSVYPALQAPTLAALAEQLEVPAAEFLATLDGYNQAVQPGQFNPSKLDNCMTLGLQPPKSHWARPITQAPFFAYPLRCGITFTYLGVAVDAQAKVLFSNVEPAPPRCASNIFAAGEIMAGNILGQGYLAGIGMTIGSVFGRLAGTEAGAAVRG